MGNEQQAGKPRQALKRAFIEHLSIGPITTGRESKTQLSRGR